MRGCLQTMKCSRATRSIFSDLRHAVFILAVSIATTNCDVSHGNEKPEDTALNGLTFDRKEIADHSGDVKLVGDIDGDGQVDFVLGGLPEDPLSWWHGPDLRKTTIATARIEFTTDGVLADVDDDGDLDIITADGPDGVNLIWFENPRPNGDPADGHKWKRHEIGEAGGWGKDIKAADFDGDGRLDIVVRAPGEVVIFFQNEPIAWIGVAFSSFNLGEEGMAIGDIDSDGNIDLVLCGVWAHNPGGVAARDAPRWQSYPVGPFNPAFKALVIDIDQDGRVDILSSSSEHTADVAWFRAESGPSGHWVRHVIQPAVAGAHTLQAADMDRDGDIDIVVGQMHQTEERTLAVHYNRDGRGTRWTRQIIDDTGLHNGVVADVDSDDDFDIYGANWAGHPPLRVWINLLNPPAPTRRLDRWVYHRITNAHVRSFGLAFADMDGDGRMDIVSGPFWYRQPPLPWQKGWEQIRLGEGLDAVEALDLDGDGRAEATAQRNRGKTLQFHWLKTVDAVAHKFEEHVIGEVPAATHDLGSQGHVFAQIVEGGLPELAVSSGNGVFYFTVPDDPTAPWPRTRICAEASDEGIAFTDLDGDGLIDLVASTGEAKEVAWWRNPGDGSRDWQRRDIAKVPEMDYPDRVAAADLDGDGYPDIVVAEENGAADGARASWWRGPATGSFNWERHEITSRGSLNSLSVADMDGDGRLDLVMAEHRGALRMSLWRNVGGGNFIEQLIGEGFESHLGARAVDLDGDGDLDVVSIAWDAPGAIHAWRNDAVEQMPSAPEPGQLRR